MIIYRGKRKRKLFKRGENQKYRKYFKEEQAKFLHFNFSYFHSLPILATIAAFFVFFAVFLVFRIGITEQIRFEFSIPVLQIHNPLNENALTRNVLETLKPNLGNWKPSTPIIINLISNLPIEALNEKVNTKVTILTSNLEKIIQFVNPIPRVKYIVLEILHWFKSTWDIFITFLSPLDPRLGFKIIGSIVSKGFGHAFEVINIVTPMMVVLADLSLQTIIDTDVMFSTTYTKLSSL